MSEFAVSAPWFNLGVNDYLAIAVVGVLTYVFRASFVASKTPLQLNVNLRILLDHIPGACLIALVLPMVWVIDGSLTFDVPRSIALAMAALVGFVSQNLYLPLVVGFATLWLSQIFLNNYL